MIENLRIHLLQIRRSSATIAVPLAAITIGLHVFLRPTSWRYEWLRVFDSFHLVTLLVCPIFAGVAAWDGIRYAKARQYLLTGDRQQRAVVGSFLASASTAVASYVLGLTVVTSYAVVRGIAGLPRFADLLTVAPALALVLLSVAFGFAAGWRSRSPYVVPLTAIGFFGLLMVSFELPGVFVEVGGATGTLLGLQPKTHLQLAQTTLFLTLAVLLLASCLQPWRRDRRVILGLAAALLIGITAAGTILTSGGLRFEAAPVELQCEPEPHTGQPLEPTIPICLHPSYEDFREPIAVELQEPLLRMTEAGLLRTPSKITMDPNDVSPGATYVDPLTFQFGDPYAPVNALMSTLIPERCDVFASEELGRAYNGLVYWLHAASGHRPDVDDPSIPTELLQWDSAEAQRWAAQNTELLAECGE